MKDKNKRLVMVGIRRKGEKGFRTAVEGKNPAFKEDWSPPLPCSEAIAVIKQQQETMVPLDQLNQGR